MSSTKLTPTPTMFCLRTIQLTSALKLGRHAFLEVGQLLSAPPQKDACMPSVSKHDASGYVISSPKVQLSHLSLFPFCYPLFSSAPLRFQFKYDTVHGKFDGTVEVDGMDLILDGQRVPTSHTRNPEEIPFTATGAQYVCESTGAFLTEEKVQPHLKAGAKKIVFSAPAKDDSHTIVMGVNAETYESSMDLVSCASCTTNGLAPTVKVINDNFGIKEALMTTVHAMTATQMVVDGTSKKDWRGGRCASSNIIPSSTGAAKAVTKVRVSYACDFVRRQ